MSSSVPMPLMHVELMSKQTPWAMVYHVVNVIVNIPTNVLCVWFTNAYSIAPYMAYNDSYDVAYFNVRAPHLYLDRRYLDRRYLDRRYLNRRYLNRRYLYQ